MQVKLYQKSEQKYCKTYRELLAVNGFVKHSKHFLYRNNFLIWTDHALLIWLRNFKNPEGMLARWISNLSRMPYPYCKRFDCPECKSRSSSCHAAAKTNKNDFILLISVASIQNDMQDDYPDCHQSNRLDTWSNDNQLEMQRNDPILSKFIT